MVVRRENRYAVVLRVGILVHALRPEGEVGERVDGLAGVPTHDGNAGVERHQIGVDLVGELHHCRLDHAVRQFLDVQGELLAGELEVDALELVDDWIVVDASVTSCTAMTAPSRTVKSVGLRMVSVSPTV
jgi:hypothetical protein